MLQKCLYQQIVQHYFTKAIKAQEAFALDKVNLIQAKNVLLSNGMQVYVIDGSEEEVIRLELVFIAGTRAEKNVLIANATNHLLNAGTNKMTSAEIMESIDFYGAYYQHENQLDRSSVSLYTLKKYFKETIAIFSEIIQDPI